MSWFEWTDDLELGVSALNEQHKKLLGLMQKLQDQTDENASQSALLITLSELNCFSEKHFAEEEAYMRSINAPDLKDHQRLHAKLLKKLAHHTQDFKDSDQCAIGSAFFEFLQVWLQTHIMAIDTRYAPQRLKKMA